MPPAHGAEARDGEDGLPLRRGGRGQHCHGHAGGLQVEQDFLEHTVYYSRNLSCFSIIPICH